MKSLILFRNDQSSGNWLKVALKGINAETSGIGSRVTIVVGNTKMIREIDGGGSSHLSQNSTIAHFGLGNAKIVDSVIVTWIGGKKQLLTDQPINQLLTITEKEDENENINIILFIVSTILILILVIAVFFSKRKSASIS